LSIRTQRGSTRFGVAAIAAALIASLFAFASPAGAVTVAQLDPTRYAGADRYDTAAKAALDTFGTTPRPNIVIASGENFPDGLSAAYLAGAFNGPLLLTASDSLPLATANALGVFGNSTSTVHIVGGTAAVSEAVANQIAAQGYTVKRVSGADRYETAAKISAAANAVVGVGQFQNSRTAIVATGANYPDALAAGPMAFRGHHPILLTDSAALSADADTALTSLAIQRVVILGGTAAVSQAVEDAITAKGIAVQRVSGADRFETAAKLATVLRNTELEGGADWLTASSPAAPITLARGTNFPDALAASQVGGARYAPIILTGSLPTASGAWLSANIGGVSKLYVMGGTAAVDSETIQAVADALTAPTLEATITAEPGRPTFTVEFSAPVIANNPAGANDATNPANYRVNNGATSVTGVTYNATNNTATVTVDTTARPNGLAINDVVVASVSNSISNAVGVRVAQTSATVGLDTAKPVGTLQAFTGPVASNNNVWVVFNEPVKATTGTVSISGGTPVSLTGVGTPVTVGGTGHYLVWGVSTSIGEGQVATIAADQFTDMAGNTSNKLEVTATKDQAGPTLSSATYSVVASTNPADLATLEVVTNGATHGTDPSITITAKAQGTATGLAGNDWKIVPGAVNPAGVTITVNSALREIGVNAPNLTTVNANALVVALNSTGAFNGMFAATVDANGPIDITDLDDDTTAGGESIVTVKLQFSEALNPTISGVLEGAITTKANVALAGSTWAVSSSGSSPLTGLQAYSYSTTTSDNLPKSITVVANSVRDLAGNGNALQPQTAVNAG